MGDNVNECLAPPTHSRTKKRSNKAPPSTLLNTGIKKDTYAIESSSACKMGIKNNGIVYLGRVK